VAERIRGTLGRNDLAGRYGGEEFIAILPRTTANDAMKLAEKLRKAIAAPPFALNATVQPTTVTMSFGVASVAPTSEHAVESGECARLLVAQADAALYDSKHGGRNRVTLAQP
jgi:two-component system cell cycle response regulator